MKGNNGGRAHVRREMVKNRMHLVCATDASLIFGPCCGVGSRRGIGITFLRPCGVTRRSGPRGAVSKETAANLSRPTTSSTLPFSLFFSVSFFLFLTADSMSSDVYVPSLTRITMDGRFISRRFEQNKVCVLLRRMTSLYSIWDGKRGLN